MRIKVYILHKHERSWSISNHCVERQGEGLVWQMKGRRNYLTLDQILRNYQGSPIPVLRLEEGDEYPYIRKERGVDPQELSEAKPLKEFIKELLSGNFRPLNRNT